MTATRPPLTWDRRGTDFWSTPGGRFDLLRRADGLWVAMDHDAGRIVRMENRCEAELWCEQRAREGG